MTPHFLQMFFDANPRAVRENNQSCTTLLKANTTTPTQMRKFNCPENAKPGDVVAWQTLVCLSNAYKYSISTQDQNQGTSAFR